MDGAISLEARRARLIEVSWKCLGSAQSKIKKDGYMEGRQRVGWLDLLMWALLGLCSVAFPEVLYEIFESFVTVLRFATIATVIFGGIATVTFATIAAVLIFASIASGRAQMKMKKDRYMEDVLRDAYLDQLKGIAQMKMKKDRYMEDVLTDCWLEATAAGEVTKWRLKQLEEENLCLKMKVEYEAIKISRATDKLEETEQRNMKLEKKLQEQEIKLERTLQKYKEAEQRNMKLEEKLQEQERKLEQTTELDRYEMGESPRGICLVINNVNFLGEGERRGGETDEKEITDLFSKELHFILEVRRNLGGLEILKTAQEIAAKDHSKYKAFVLIIMSHGEKRDVIQGVDGRKARVEDLMSEFTATSCPTLQNKPKLFFIQACRGRRSDPRMNRLPPAADNIEGDTIATLHSPDSTLANGVSPEEADFLLAFATVPDYQAWRSKIEGSWFIQVLVDVIRRYHRHHHLLDMLTEVNKKVADIANEHPQVDLSFQVPAPTNTLRAQVFI